MMVIVAGGFVATSRIDMCTSLAIGFKVKVLHDSNPNLGNIQFGYQTVFLIFQLQQQYFSLSF